ncbi:MAG: hypothetical protein V8R51_00700 [Clostridia bacterium]
MLEEKSPKYQQVNSYTNKISDKVRVEKKKEKAGTSEILLKNSRTKKTNEPVVIPSAIGLNKKKILTKRNQGMEDNIQQNSKLAKQESFEDLYETSQDIGTEGIQQVEEVVQPVKREGDDQERTQ